MHIFRNYWWINVRVKKYTYLLKTDNKLSISQCYYNSIIMEYQKTTNLLNDESNKPSKFTTRNWVKIDDNVRGEYSSVKQIKFKTTMLRFSLCDYSDAYILVKWNIIVNNTAVAAAATNNTNKKVIFKNCGPFTKCISKINNTQIDNAEYIGIGMSLYNFIEYSDNY